MSEDDPKTNTEALAALFERAAELSREPIVFGDEATENTSEK